MRCTKRIGLGLMLCGAATVLFLPGHPWEYEPSWAKWPDEVHPVKPGTKVDKHPFGQRVSVRGGEHRADAKLTRANAAASAASVASDSTAGAKKILPAASRAGCQVPHILHQTWKDREVQSVFESRIASWVTKNPEWKYRFWTDADNRDLIKTIYPESLDMFDGYHSNIQRADAIRYFILYEYGGMYADLDFEALRPLGQLLESSEMADVGVILGQEPYAHSRVLYDQPRMLCNAIMISCPHHPFWKAVIDELHARYDAGIKTVRATGPRMLTDVVEAWMNTTEGSTPASMPAGTGGRTGGDVAAVASGSGRLYIPEPEMFYPLFDDGNSRVRETCEQGKCFECKQKDAEGHLIRKDGPLSPRQVRLQKSYTCVVIRLLVLSCDVVSMWSALPRWSIAPS
jgi:hypothetical protein